VSFASAPRCSAQGIFETFQFTAGTRTQHAQMLEGMDEILVDLRAGPSAPVIVCVHYACPHIEYLDRGKSRIGLE
jgi:hypothetical protein